MSRNAEDWRGYREALLESRSKVTQGRVVLEGLADTDPRVSGDEWYAMANEAVSYLDTAEALINRTIGTLTGRWWDDVPEGI